jgi:hypothetical protein
VYKAQTDNRVCGFTLRLFFLNAAGDAIKFTSEGACNA